MKGLWVLMAFLLVCPAPGWSQDAPTAGETDPAMDGRRDFFDGLLTQGKSLADRGFYYEASVAFNGILERGEPTESYYQEAEFAIATSLYDLGLVYSAFSYLTRIVDAGEEHARFKEALPWMLRIHTEMPGLQAAVEYMSLYAAEDYPADDADEIHLVVGRYAYSIDDHETALSALGQVTEANPEFYLKSRYLSGVVYVRQRKAKDALDALKDVLRHRRDVGTRSLVARKIYQSAMITTARIFYSTGQFDTALKYYDQIERYSDNWLQSLFEKSWTYFRSGDYERAMGNLHTLNSPYFEEQYFPESRVVQAVILYANCRYEDAIVVVDQFVKDYDALRKELASNLEQNEDATDFYYWLSTLGQKGKRFSARLKRIFNLALKDQKLHRLFSLIVSLNREEALLEAMRQTAIQKDLAERLLGELVTYRELAIGETGEQARARLGAVHRDLRKLVGSAMKVKFESLNALKEIIEGKRDKTREEGEETARRKADKKLYLNWPFEGEYWKDELDSYLFRVENLCPTQK